ncbi:hypothetical protein ACFV23_23200, partial [Streptomyces sp. NPDC059627]
MAPEPAAEVQEEEPSSLPPDPARVGPAPATEATDGAVCTWTEVPPPLADFVAGGGDDAPVASVDGDADGEADGDMDGGGGPSRLGVLSYEPPSPAVPGTVPDAESDDRLSSSWARPMRKAPPISAATTTDTPVRSTARGNRRGDR